MSLQNLRIIDALRETHRPMHESRELIKLVAIALVIALAALALFHFGGSLFEGDLVVDSYRAELMADGTLVEQYVYEVKSDDTYRMLYRSWDDRLMLRDAAWPHIRFIDMEGPAGSTPYVMDAYGEVAFRDAAGEASRAGVEALAERNEAGIYDPSSFAPGYYPVAYTFRICPPLAADGEYTRLDLLLMDSHVPYRTVEVIIPAGMAEEVYVHPATYEVATDGDRIVITGASPVDEPLTLQLLLTPAAAAMLEGFPGPADDVRAGLAAENALYGVPFAAGSLAKTLAYLLVLMMPLLFAGIHVAFGREQEATVPDYLSFVPDPAVPPWKVNLVFSGCAYHRDENGFYATLLDLHRRNKILLAEKADGEGLIVTVLDDEGLDAYEQKVVAFIREAAGETSLDTGDLEALAKRAGRDLGARMRVVGYEKRLQRLMEGGDRKVSATYGTDGRIRLAPLAIAAGMLLVGGVLLIVWNPDTVDAVMPAVLLAAVALIQGAVAWHFPATLFGTWKGDFYRQKLEWDAFARFLSDLAQIKRYGAADLPLWGEWLVYGTALGVGEKVERAMEALSVDVRSAGFVDHAHLVVGFQAVGTFTSSSGGGSGGGAGGFGGGGAGGR
jgi:uncharacterized membrane protein